MANRHFIIKCTERTGKSAGGIALDYEELHPSFAEYLIQFKHNRAYGIAERGFTTHHIEPIIRRRHRVFELQIHILMLACKHGLELKVALLKLVDDRRKLDDLRSRTVTYYDHRDAKI